MQTPTGREIHLFLKAFLCTWSSIIFQLLITLLPINVLGATKYLGQFPVHLFTERDRAEWGNQKPLEETGRALGLERDTSPHGKDWHSMWIHHQAWKGEQPYSSLLHGTSPKWRQKSTWPQGSLPLHPQRNTRWSEASRASTFTSHTTENLTQWRPAEPASRCHHPRQLMQLENKGNAPFSPPKLSVKFQRESQLF